MEMDFKFYFKVIWNFCTVTSRAGFIRRCQGGSGLPQSKCCVALLRMNKFQIFRQNFSCDMSKMHFYNKFSKIAKGWALRPQHPLTFDIGDLKLRDFAKMWFFKLIMTKSNFKKISYHAVSVTSSQLRHRKTPLKQRHKILTYQIFNQ